MISVIILAYSDEEYLERAIKSILNQTFTDFELILVDNGSMNRCGEMCDEYEKKDHRISVIHKQKGNIGSGRNAGLSVVKGDFIIFIDDDDIAEPDMLDFLYKLIIKHQADISICGSWYFTNGAKAPKYIYNELLELDTEQAIVELLRRKYYNIASAAKMFRRKIIPENPYTESGNFDDITTVYKIFAVAQKVVAHGIPKYTFFRYDGNLSAFTTNFQLLTPEILNEYLNAFRYRTIYLSEKFPAIKNYIQYAEWSFMLSMSEKILRYDLQDCKKHFFQMQNILEKSKLEKNPYLQEFEREWLNKIME